MTVALVQSKRHKVHSTRHHALQYGPQYLTSTTQSSSMSCSSLTFLTRCPFCTHHTSCTQSYRILTLGRCTCELLHQMLFTHRTQIYICDPRQLQLCLDLQKQGQALKVSRGCFAKNQSFVAVTHLTAELIPCVAVKHWYSHFPAEQDCVNLCCSLNCMYPSYMGMQSAYRLGLESLT